MREGMNKSILAVAWRNILFPEKWMNPKINDETKHRQTQRALKGGKMEYTPSKQTITKKHLDESTTQSDDRNCLKKKAGGSLRSEIMQWSNHEAMISSIFYDFLVS